MNTFHKSRFKEITGEHDHHYENNAICPYCGFIEQDSWELNSGEEGKK